MFIKRWSFLAVVLTAAAGSAVQARCAGHLGLLHLQTPTSYNPFHSIDTVMVFTLSARNTGRTPCNYTVHLQSAAVPPNFGNLITYDITSASDTVRIGAGEQGSFPLSARIPRGQIYPPGTYGDALTVVLAATEGSTPSVPVDQAVVNISCHVRAVVGLNIAGRGVNTAVDFGELQSGDTRNLILQIRANQRYRIALQSQHGGRLVRDGDRASDSSTISYALAVDDVRLETTAATAVFEISVDGRETHRKLKIQIGDVRNKLAGRYRDTVVIRLIAEP